MTFSEPLVVDGSHGEGGGQIVRSALAGPSRFVAQRATAHLATQAWLVERFGVARVGIDEGEDGTARVAVEPLA